MKYATLFRIALTASALAAALAAHAVNFSASAFGTYTAGATTTYTESVDSLVTPYGALSSLSFGVVSPTLGSGSFTGLGGTLNVLFSITSTQVLGSSEYQLGNWSATGGLGSYGSATGGGQFVILKDTTSDKVHTDFFGDVQAVPEPASLCALGVGAVGLLRRRRKA